MNKVEKVKEIFKEKHVVGGRITRQEEDGIHTKSFIGLTVYVEGENIVFATIGKQQELSESVIDEIIDDKHITISTRDEKGPIKIHIDLIQVP